MSRNIKDYNNYINTMVIIDICILMGTNISATTMQIKEISSGILDISFISTLVIPLICSALNNIVPSNVKASIVFLKLKNPLPGTRVFSKLIYKDERFDAKKVFAKYGEINMLPEKQNNLWYTIFQKYKDEPLVLYSHRNFLMFRDLTTISFELTCVYLGLLIMSYGNLIQLSLLLLQTIILMTIAQIKGNRFTLNVIARDVSN